MHMIINLLEIPDGGATYELNPRTGELNESLSDLIGKSAYAADFFIRPLEAGTYEFSGKIKTMLPETCSRCGIDIQWPISESFKELLMPEIKVDRTEKYAKANHYSDLNHSGPSVTEYTGHKFNVGEFFHELVGLAIPFNPAPPANENGDCGTCLIDLKNRSFGFDEVMEKPESPFSGLKGLKLN